MATATATTGKSTAKAAPRTTRKQPQPAAPSNGRGRRRHAPNLVIVESPTKARTVKNILGDDYEVIASVGHVRDLPPYGYGVEDIESMNFTPKYVVVKDKRRGVDKTEVVSEIAAAAKAVIVTLRRRFPSRRKRPSPHSLP